MFFAYILDCLLHARWSSFFYTGFGWDAFSRQNCRITFTTLSGQSTRKCIYCVPCTFWWKMWTYSTLGAVQQMKGMCHTCGPEFVYTKSGNETLRQSAPNHTTITILTELAIAWLSPESGWFFRIRVKSSCFCLFLICRFFRAPLGLAMVRGGYILARWKNFCACSTWGANLVKQDCNVGTVCSLGMLQLFGFQFSESA